LLERCFQLIAGMITGDGNDFRIHLHGSSEQCTGLRQLIIAYIPYVEQVDQPATNYRIRGTPITFGQALAQPDGATMSPPLGVENAAAVLTRRCRGSDTKMSTVPVGKEPTCDCGLSSEFDFLRWGKGGIPSYLLAVFAIERNEYSGHFVLQLTGSW
jgi:hypothetical protein